MLRLTSINGNIAIIQEINLLGSQRVVGPMVLPLYNGTL
jgi:hypothetical protein